ncbi:hypothetical protein B0I35DRAFT_440740 [Stachybotrys elegans]|uniref:Zn(2)-C6 fungal-type domain-containing protein n=1 Tax=Stachybotrys elegans TaxID=80388 RepID=A0A8K0SKF3_9HYPO|nr:hypothetical protein B0I35DRAFT_440740 [Stachybotrys elegans]
MRKRYRACEACHRLKIRCDGSPATGGPCERCTRNNLQCVPAAPRLQRDRISELEAQVQALQSTLREKSSSTTPSVLSSDGAPENLSHGMLAFLDARIPPTHQLDLLQQFPQQAGAAWPVIRPPQDLDLLRQKSPILLLSLMAYCFTQQAQDTDLEVHEGLVRETMRLLGNEVIGRGQRSLELVQALLVSAFWNKFTRSGMQGSPYQVIQLAADMAIDLGIGGFSLLPSPAAFFCRLEDPYSLDARRTWLACFIALSTSSLSTRRPHTVPWNAYHEQCVALLEAQGDVSDLLLCQIVRITRLVEEISTNLSLCQVDSFVDCNSPETEAVMHAMKAKVDEWAAQVPPSLASSPTLAIWNHLAIMYIYEPVLHTPTNKGSFAAPFIPGRIPVQDIPKPDNITPRLQAALGALVHHGHAIIDVAAHMDPELVINLPSFCFSPIVVYALFVLATGLVVAADPESTYRQHMGRDGFQIDECGNKLKGLVDRLKSLDPTMSCWTTKLFDATGWLQQWHSDYSTIVERYERSVSKS